jgi:hypothetical protein
MDFRQCSLSSQITPTFELPQTDGRYVIGIDLKHEPPDSNLFFSEFWALNFELFDDRGWKSGDCSRVDPSCRNYLSTQSLIGLSQMPKQSSSFANTMLSLLILVILLWWGELASEFLVWSLLPSIIHTIPFLFLIPFILFLELIFASISFPGVRVVDLWNLWSSSLAAH